jgi:hypothetical protein
MAVLAVCNRCRVALCRLQTKFGDNDQKLVGVNAAVRDEASALIIGRAETRSRKLLRQPKRVRERRSLLGSVGRGPCSSPAVLGAPFAGRNSRGLRVAPLREPQSAPLLARCNETDSTRLQTAFQNAPEMVGISLKSLIYREGLRLPVDGMVSAIGIVTASDGAAKTNHQHRTVI